MNNATNQTSKFVSWEDAVAWLISQPDRQELVQQCYFDRPVRDAVERYGSSEEWVAIKEFLPSAAGRVLDIGAGNGLVSVALAKAGWKVTALEPDPSQFVGAGAIRNIASEDNLPIKVVEQFGESMPFDDSEFDLVIARQVVHHAHDLDQMMAEVSRVLTPGGRFIMLRDHLVDSEDDLVRFRDEHPLHNLYGGENAFRLSEYKAALARAGLGIQHELHQFDSVINYAPKTKADLCGVVTTKIRPTWLRPFMDRLLASEPLFSLVTKTASKFYRKPGRLVTFICDKSKVASAS
ncbi:MAG: methyltransferase domain-containing protein [Planctomycetota bacterium]